MKKVKKVRRKISEFFKPEEIGDKTGVNLADKLVVMNPNNYKPEYQQRKFLVWYCYGGGFGCNPNAMGQAIIARCVGDGEEARINRCDVMGVFLGKENDV